MTEDTQPEDPVMTDDSHPPNRQQQGGDQHPSAASSTVPQYMPIQPRGDPNKHRQAMAEEKKIEDTHIIDERRRRNTLAAARMRERQRKRERGLVQRRNELTERMNQLEAELVALRTQRYKQEAITSNEDYEELFEQLSSKLETATATMNLIIVEIEKLVEIVKSINI
ncbi:hypothetical protein COEREDRAFT_79965 [Coemansia reversa NRRL 1564]|uniref:BZIP domain-containing protein n=1 Tax=Coemansia reversa (strain ATCC 12441 / NRRL 1564) TaxID=763665 RepID=A0A2G5BG65_COERN|nr:hypothetical protein COEREDRAFT_79965 [Coemansia reversa NRRL 1564]|eukprot:PIA18016.1 hypothetical protein COEREDRAFT_79965 [Coemansia reversa NRRL 1564]